MTESTYLRKEGCPACGSRDNLGVYTDHKYCFGCGYYEWTDKSTKPELKADRSTLGLSRWQIPEEGLPERKLSAEVMKRYRYGISLTGRGELIHVANYVDEGGSIVAQKLRFPNKEFPWMGEAKKAMPFGFDLWKAGKRLVITEGEIDCLTVAQLQKLSWPVWSVRSGARGARKELLAVLPTLEQFEEVVLLFDNDKPGREAAEETANAICGSVKVKVATLVGYKDPNEAWVKGAGQNVLQAIWNAPLYKPKTIISALDVIPSIKAELQEDRINYPWPGLQEVTQGFGENNIVTIIAGSGSGKSTFCRHLAHALQMGTSENVGGLFIEESVQQTVAGVLGIELGHNLVTNPSEISDETILEATRRLKLDTKPMYLFDLSFETVDTEELLSQIRYMAKSLGCKYIILDHLSFIVGGMEVDNERKAIDVLMTKLRGLVKSTNITLFLVVHLKRPDGNRGYDEGLQISTNFIRGSQAIEQLSDTVLALQRNKRDPNLHNWIEVVILKHRFNGNDGITACWLEYDPDTGVLTEGKPKAPFGNAEVDLDEYGFDGTAQGSGSEGDRDTTGLVQDDSALSMGNLPF